MAFDRATCMVIKLSGFGTDFLIIWVSHLSIAPEHGQLSHDCEPRLYAGPILITVVATGFAQEH